MLYSAPFEDIQPKLGIVVTLVSAIAEIDNGTRSRCGLSDTVLDRSR